MRVAAACRALVASCLTCALAQRQIVPGVHEVPGSVVASEFTDYRGVNAADATVRKKDKALTKLEGGDIIEYTLIADAAGTFAVSYKLESNAAKADAEAVKIALVLGKDCGDSTNEFTQPTFTTNGEMLRFKAKGDIVLDKGNNKVSLCIEKAAGLSIRSFRLYRAAVTPAPTPAPTAAPTAPPTVVIKKTRRPIKRTQKPIQITQKPIVRRTVKPTVPQAIVPATKPPTVAPATPPPTVAATPPPSAAAAATPAPSVQTVFEVPGDVQAESYTAYKDELVGTGPKTGDGAIGYLMAGEYYQYTVDVAEAANYAFNVTISGVPPSPVRFKVHFEVGATDCKYVDNTPYFPTVDVADFAGSTRPVTLNATNNVMAVPAGTQQLTLCIDDASYVTIDTFGLEPSDKGVAVAPPPNTSTIMNSAVITLVVIFGAGILIAGAVLLARRTVCKRKRAVPPEYALKDAVLAGGGGGARSRSGSGSDTPMSVASPAPSSTVLTRSASASNAAVPGMLSSTGGAPPPRHGGGGVFGAGGSMRGFSSAPYTASSVSPFIGIGPYSSGTGPYRSRSNTAGPPERGTASRHASFSRQHSAQPSPMP